MGKNIPRVKTGDGSLRHGPAFGRNFEDLFQKHGEKEALDLLRVMIEEVFPGRIAVVTSFGAESAVLLDLVSRISRSTPVIFLDTRKHFLETLEYRTRLIKHLGLTDVRNQYPDATDVESCDPNGELCEVNPDQCCHIRKVLPLEKALLPFEAWVTGRKRFQSESRTRLDAIEFDETHIKINPLASWDVARVSSYLADRGLPRHPLVELGYPSIGCAPCTRAIREGESLRDGRWADRTKTECGIHKVVEGQ